LMAGAPLSIVSNRILARGIKATIRAKYERITMNLLLIFLSIYLLILDSLSPFDDP
jgi:hypothetical protein